MDIRIEYGEVSKKYPSATQQALEALRLSKNKLKDEDPDKLDWRISYIQQANTMKEDELLDILFGAEPLRVSKQAWEYGDFEEYFDSIRHRIITTVAVMPAAKGLPYHSELLPEIPEEVVERYRSSWEKDKDKQAKFNALSPEEQDAEVQRLLKQLTCTKEEQDGKGEKNQDDR